MRAVEFLNETTEHEGQIVQRLKSILIANRASGLDSVLLSDLKGHMDAVNLNMTPLMIKQVVSAFPFVDEVTDDEIHFVTVDDSPDEKEENKKAVQGLAKKAVERGIK